MKTLIRRLIQYIISNISPRTAEILIVSLEHRIGIGSGVEVTDSGENNIFTVIREICDEPLVVFDVGANQGQYTSAALSCLTGVNRFSIHCFEPSVATFKKLSEKHSNNSKVILNNFGLAASAQRSILYMDKEGSGLASLTSRKLNHFGINHSQLQEVVNLETLDDYCTTRRVKSISLLKIDVEGHELDVLRGAHVLMKQKQIEFVQFEFGGCNIDTRTFFQDFFRYFESLDFDIYRIIAGGNLYRIPTYRECDEKFRTSNYLACQKMHSDKLARIIAEGRFKL